MSEIRATTISDLVGTGPVTLTGQSAAKAWSNLNGTGTIAERDSFNISGYVDNGTGDYTFTISNDMSDANYQASSTASNRSNVIINDTTQLSGSFDTRLELSNTGASQDADTNQPAIHGDLA